MDRARKHHVCRLVALGAALAPLLGGPARSDDCVGAAAAHGDKLTFSVAVDDTDAFAVELSEGGTFALKTKAAKSTSVLPRLRVFRPDGSELTTLEIKKPGTTKPSFKKLAPQPGETGTWQVVVDDPGGGTGAVTAVFKITLPKKTKAKAQSVAAGESAEVAFTASGGALVTVKTKEKDGAPLAGLRLLDPAGEEVEGFAGAVVRKGSSLSVKKFAVTGRFGRFRLVADGDAAAATLFDATISVKHPKHVKRKETLGPELRLDDVEDPVVKQEDTGRIVRVVGNRFSSVPGSRAQVSGDGVTVRAVNVVSITTADLVLDVAPDAPFGTRDLVVCPPPTVGEPQRLTAALLVEAPTPVIAGVSQAPLVQGTFGTVVEATGNGFRAGGTLSVAGDGLTVGATVFVDGSTVRTTVDTAFGATLTPRTVTWTQPAAGGGESTESVATVPVHAAVPTLANVSPTNIPQGSTDLPLSLGGTRFRDGGTVSLGDGIESGSQVRVSDNQFSVRLTVDDDAALGPRDVVYAQPAAAGGAEAVLENAVTIVAPVPVVSAASPSSLSPGDGTTTVTITGTGFRAGGSVSFAGDGLTVGSTTFVNDTTASVDVTVGAGATGGVRTVTFTHGAAQGGYAGGADVFSVTVPAPTVTSVSPADLVQGDSGTLTLTGTNFTPGGTVVVEGTGVAISDPELVSTTTFRVDFDSTAAAAVGPRDLTFTQESAAGGGEATLEDAVEVTEAGMLVDSVTPSRALPGTARLSVVLDGMRFETGTTVSFSGTGIVVHSATVTGTTQMTLSVTLATDAAIGERDITLTPSSTTPAKTFEDAFVVAAALPHRDVVQPGGARPRRVVGVGHGGRDELPRGRRARGLRHGRHVLERHGRERLPDLGAGERDVDRDARLARRHRHAPGDRRRRGRHAGRRGRGRRRDAERHVVPARRAGAHRQRRRHARVRRRDHGNRLRERRDRLGRAREQQRPVGRLRQRDRAERHVDRRPRAADGRSDDGPVERDRDQPRRGHLGHVRQRPPRRQTRDDARGQRRRARVGRAARRRTRDRPRRRVRDRRDDRLRVRPRRRRPGDRPEHGDRDGSDADVDLRSHGDRSRGEGHEPGRRERVAHRRVALRPGRHHDVRAKNGPGARRERRAAQPDARRRPDVGTVRHDDRRLRHVVSERSALVPVRRHVGHRRRTFVRRRPALVRVHAQRRQPLVVDEVRREPAQGRSSRSPGRRSRRCASRRWCPTSTTTRPGPARTTRHRPSRRAHRRRPPPACPPTARVTLTFSEALDPLTVNATSITLKQGSTTVSAQRALSEDLTTVTLSPDAELAVSTTYTVATTTGLKDLCGNAMASTSRTFTTGSATDATAPVIDAVVIEDLRSDMDGSTTYVNSSGTSTAFDLYLPRDGWQIEVRFSDEGGAGIDTASFSAKASVAVGSNAANAELASNFDVTATRAVWRVPSGTSFATGENVALSFSVKDLAATPNTSTTKTVTVDVADRNATVVHSSGGDHDPFDSRRTWVLRTDLDKYTSTYHSNPAAGFTGRGLTTTATSNNVNDLHESLRQAGLGSGSPTTAAANTVNGPHRGTNAIVAAIFMERVRALTRVRYEIEEDGTRDADSIDVEFLLLGEQGSLSSLPQVSTSNSQSTSNAFSEISLGGTDGAESSQTSSIGAYGSAWLDERNLNEEANLNDPASSITGVFVSTSVDLRAFSASGPLVDRVLKVLVSERGGTAVGDHASDDDILAGTFDRTTSTNVTHNARYDAVFDAIETLALHVSVVLAHEVGHSQGLVAAGAPKTGLFGGANASNTFTDATSTSPNTSAHLDYVGYEVMAATGTVLSDAQTGTNFARFNPMILAWLRGRLLYDEGK